MKRVARCINNFTSCNGKLPFLLTRFIRVLLTLWLIVPFELLTMYLLTSTFGFHYIFSAGLTYILGYTVEFFFVRRWGFKGTKETIKKSYSIFFALNLFRLIAVLSLMAFLVEHFGVNYIIARVLASCIIVPIIFIGHYIFSFNLKKNFFSELSKSCNFEKDD